MTSELASLMDKNLERALSDEELESVSRLIKEASPMDASCWACGTYGKKTPSIYDTKLCGGHAMYAIVTRK